MPPRYPPAMVLDDILDRIRSTVAEGRLPVLVLDVDGTLTLTEQRHHRILQEFARDHGHRFPRASAVIADTEASDIGYDVRDLLRARGITDDDCLTAVHRFWVPRFFHSDYCREDPSNPGAVEFCRAAWEAGAFLWYLTARPAPTMLEGTVWSLRRLGFPVFVARTTLQLKPVLMQGDAEYKTAAIEEIAAFPGDVVASFENEPGNAHHFADAFPAALHVLVGDNRSPSAPEPRSTLVAIHDFTGRTR